MQCWILNPLSKARDWFCIPMAASWVLYCWAMKGNFFFLFKNWSIIGYVVSSHICFCWAMTGTQIFFLFKIFIEIVDLLYCVNFCCVANDSVLFICIYIMYTYTLLKIIFTYKLLQNTEYISLCYTVGPYWLPILYIAVCIF